MREFNIDIRSLQQIRDFVRLAAVQPFEVVVGNHHQTINGKDLMGMYVLDYSRPVQVSVRCSEEEFCRFRQNVLALTA